MVYIKLKLYTRNQGNNQESDRNEEFAYFIIPA